MKALFTNGTVSVDLCGPDNVWRQNTRQFDAEAVKHTTEQISVFELQNFQEIKSAAAMGGIVNFAMECDSTQIANYKSGIMPAFHGIGNHSVTGCDVELFQGKLVLTGKNHWGRKWGMNGFFLCGEATVRETIPVHGAWAAFSTQEAGF